MADPSPIVAADALDCGYAGRQVLRQVSLHVVRGEVLVLAGPNGSGKTTLLRALGRLLKPSGGAVVIFQGRDIWSLKAEEVARRTAIAPQNERRDWPLTVSEAVHLGRAPHRGWFLPFTADDEAAVQTALEQTGLRELAERPITELSGGEWRRMILARALAQQAQVLLLDEPTTGLDLKYQIEMLSLIRQLAKAQGLSVAVSLHDLNHAVLFGDRLALLCDRQLLAIGEPAQVLTAEHIATAYGIEVSVARHPIYGTPLVAPHLPEPAAEPGMASTAAAKSPRE